MAQEDKGLVLRGFFLLAIIACLVAFVLTVLFWRNEPPAATAQTPPENYIPLAIAPSLAPFPANVSWAALAQLGETLPSAPGFDIRYAAARTYARRGSPATPWPVFREMLDEKQQLHNARVRQPDGREVYDEVTARATTIAALRALAAWHEKQKADPKPAASAELRDVYAIVDQLAESSYGEVKTQAEKARATFFR
jgi:hypothetical protein